jgi:hypothetical protein
MRLRVAHKGDLDVFFERSALWSFGVRRSMYSRALFLHHRVDVQLSGTRVTGAGTEQVLSNGICKLR